MSYDYKQEPAELLGLAQQALRDGTAPARQVGKLHGNYRFAKSDLAIVQQQKNNGKP